MSMGYLSIYLCLQFLSTKDGGDNYLVVTQLHVRGAERSDHVLGGVVQGLADFVGENLTGPVEIVTEEKGVFLDFLVAHLRHEGTEN